MRRNVQTLLTATALGVAAFVLVPTSEGGSSADGSMTCLEWTGEFSTTVPPDLWEIARDGKTTDFSTTSEMDAEAVEEVLAARPDGCPVPVPPPGAGGGGWQRG
jgi:hypothetical protein